MMRGYDHSFGAYSQTSHLQPTIQPRDLKRCAVLENKFLAFLKKMGENENRIGSCLHFLPLLKNEGATDGVLPPPHPFFSIHAHARVRVSGVLCFLLSLLSPILPTPFVYRAFARCRIYFCCHPCCHSFPRLPFVNRGSRGKTLAFCCHPMRDFTRHAPLFFLDFST